MKEPRHLTLDMPGKIKNQQHDIEETERHLELKRLGLEKFRNNLE